MEHGPTYSVQMGIGGRVLVALALASLLVSCDASAETLPAPPRSSDPAAGDGRQTGDDGGGGAFRCTRVLGFSQTANWYGGGTTTLEELVDSDRWEGQFLGGGTDNFVLGGPGWRAPVRSPCLNGPPDRVVLAVSAPPRLTVPKRREISIILQAALTGIRSRLPTVTRIDLTPVVGGPDHQVCRTYRPEAVPAPQGVWASREHLIVDQVIHRVAGSERGVGLGPDLVVGNCSHYADAIGHLSPGEGRDAVAAQVAEFY